MGWGLRDYKGRKLVGHSGGVAGFVTRVMLVPEENLGVVILTNAEEDVAFESVLFHILDAYLGGSTQDYIAAFKAVEDKDRKEADEKMSKASRARAADSKPSLPLEKYAGDYSDPWYGKVTIRSEKDGLVLNFERTPKGLADLQHWQYDTFKAHWRDRTVEDAFVYVHAEAGWLHRPLHHGRGLAAGGFQLRLSGFVLHAPEGSREAVTTLRGIRLFGGPGSNPAAVPRSISSRTAFLPFSP